MRLASLVPRRSQGPDIVENWVTTEEALRAGTEGGARALGLAKQIGRIAPGYKADIVFLDLHHLNWIPINDPVNQIVHTEVGSGVHSVMIGGRMVVENRKLLTVDLLQARRPGRCGTGAPCCRRWVRRGSSTTGWKKVVGSFCPGLARRRCICISSGASHHHALNVRRFQQGSPGPLPAFPRSRPSLRSCAARRAWASPPWRASPRTAGSPATCATRSSSA